MSAVRTCRTGAGPDAAARRVRKRDADVAVAGSPVRPLSPASQQSGRPDADCPTRLLAFGDSITAGVTAPPLAHALNAGIPQSYPFKLEALLRVGYPDQFFSVVNAGKPGEPAEDAVLRLPGLLQAETPRQ